MLHTNSYQRMYYLLRIAVAMCFIGHGSFGIITKPIWCNYFGVFGVGQDMAYQVMPVVGVIDILLGIGILLFPVRAIPAWLVVWGIFTALLRPLSGEPFAEFIERSGNFGAPLALLILSGRAQNLKGWFTHINPNPQPNLDTVKQLATCLKLAAFLVLLGHGWLNLIEKKGLLDQYAALGFADPKQVARIAGITEICFALITLVRPLRPLVLTFFIWKTGTELFYPHYFLLEWIERAGSYAVLLSLWMITEKPVIREYVYRLFFIRGLSER